MNQILPSHSKKQTKYHYLVFFLPLFFFQKLAAATFYINDNTTKGDIYTTAVGNDDNEGTSAAHPKLTVWAAYQKAQDGDTIIIDSGSYSDLSSKGELLFPATKKITWVIAGISESILSKTPLTKKANAVAKEFYVEKEQPVERDAYLQKLKNTTTNKP